MSRLKGSKSLITPDQTPANSWVLIGKVGRAQGLKGAFYISGRDEPIPKSYKNLRIGSELNSAQSIKVTSVRQQSGRNIMTIDSCQSRNDAEALTGKFLWVERSSIPIEKGEFLKDDLVGKQVVDCDQVEIGVIEVVENLGASDIITVAAPDGRKISLPLVASYFDMDFSGPSINLVVDLALFEELWQDKK
jgi:16S rRNA processing protein RimM